MKLAVALALVLVSTAALGQGLPQPVTTVPLPVGTLVSNGTIAAGGTFQTLDAARSSRRSFEFQNNNASHSCYIYFGALSDATTAKSLLVVAGSYYLRSVGAIPSDGIQVTCTTTADTFYATVQ